MPSYAIHFSFSKSQDFLWMTAVALMKGSPIFKHIGPASEHWAKPAVKKNIGPTAVKPRAKIPYFQWISIDDTFSPMRENGIFSGRLEGNCQEFSEKTIFLYISYGIQWHLLALNGHFWLVGMGGKTTTHCSSSDSPRLSGSTRPGGETWTALPPVQQLPNLRPPSWDVGSPSVAGFDHEDDGFVTAMILEILF